MARRIEPTPFDACFHGEHGASYAHAHRELLQSVSGDDIYAPRAANIARIKGDARYLSIPEIADSP
jgi:hypothetical protein